MIHCPHRHPYGESYCTKCQKDKAATSEKKKVLDLINHRISEAHSEDVIRTLMRLKEDIQC